jgi:hypothetical protein
MITIDRFWFLCDGSQRRRVYGKGVRGKEMQNVQKHGKM